MKHRYDHRYDAYDYVRYNHQSLYAEIVAFSSTLGGSTELDIAVRAQVEAYCMGLVHHIMRRTES